MRPNLSVFVGKAPPNTKDLRKSIQEKFPGAIVQTLSLSSADNALFLEMLAAQTLEAQKDGVLLAKSPEMDLLLRVAGTRQISQALTAVGAPATGPCLLVVASGAGRAPQQSSISGKDWRRLSRTPLTAEELRRVESAALLDGGR